MSEYNPSIININTIKDAESAIVNIGSDPASINIMAPKMILKIIKLENVTLQDAIIIKQDMLSIGGEVAVPKNTFELNKEKADILIIGTLKQHFELVKKLNRHYKRIKNISKEIEKIIKEIKWVY